MAYEFNVQNTNHTHLFNGLMFQAKSRMEGYFSDIAHDVAYIMDCFDDGEGGIFIFDWAVRKGGTQLRAAGHPMTYEEWVNMVCQSDPNADFYKIRVEISEFGNMFLTIDPVSKL